MNHSIKKDLTNGQNHVIYHAHPTNIIALTFVLPLNDKEFTRELWEMATECPVVFPDGIGVVPWMVPGGREIAVAVKEGGPDPANNFKLAQVIAKARSNNMPNETIERGIKKAA